MLILGDLVVLFFKKYSNALLCEINWIEFRMKFEYRERFGMF